MLRNTFKCYNCGGDVIVGENSKIGICSRCMAEIPLPDSSSSSVEKYSAANTLLSQSRFDEAKEAFQNILIESPMEASACWGLSVSEYGIEFVKDPDTADLIPTLHRLSEQRFSEFFYVQKAVDYAVDPDTRDFYIRQSRLIDSIQQKSLEISQKEDPFDIFICYKKTEEGEKRTADSRIARDLYNKLSARGYKVFFAEETLHVGEEFEPRIFAALHSARMLIAIASKPEYYRAVWVQNEWSRYANLVQNAKENENRLLLPIYQSFTHEQLPEELRRQEKYIEIGNSMDHMNLLFQYVADHFKQGTADDVSDIRRQVRGGGISGIKMEETAENFLMRGNVLLVNRDFRQAESMFTRSLELKESVDAYLGLLMCEKKLPNQEALHQYNEDITGESAFKKALLCADQNQKVQLRQLADGCIENQKWFEKCAMECAIKRSECDEKAEETVQLANSGKLDTNGYRQYHSMLDWCRNKSLLKDSKKRDYWILVESFLLFGNLVPALLFALTVVDPVSKILQILGILGFLLILGFYMGVFSQKILIKIRFLDGGCLTVIIRRGISLLCSMLIILCLYEGGMLYIIGFSALLALIVFLAKSLKAHMERYDYKKAVKSIEKQVEIARSVGEQMKQEAWLALDETVTPYRQYYDSDVTCFKQWKQEIKDGNTSLTDDLISKLYEINGKGKGAA